MVKTAKVHLAIFTGIIVVLVFVGNIAFGLFLQSKKHQEPIVVVPTVTQAQAQTISYQGIEGKDALTLLKEKATVEQDKSGMVAAINSIKADPATKEYWAFYVNGKLAPIGPSDYKTKDGDRIEWKIEQY